MTLKVLIIWLVIHLVGTGVAVALKYPENVNNLVLLSPVGIERHVQAVTNTDPISDRIEVPTLDPTSYKF